MKNLNWSEAIKKFGMSNICPPMCLHLYPTEAEQPNDKPPHRCTRYDKGLHHGAAHPFLISCSQCSESRKAPIATPLAMVTENNTPTPTGKPVGYWEVGIVIEDNPTAAVGDPALVSLPVFDRKKRCATLSKWMAKMEDEGICFLIIKSRYQRADEVGQ